MALNAPSSYGSVSVSSTATQIFSSSPGRRHFTIYNSGSNTIFIGFDANVTTANGIPINGIDSYVQTGPGIWMGAIFGITSTGSSTILTWEVIQ